MSFHRYVTNIGYIGKYINGERIDILRFADDIAL